MSLLLSLPLIYLFIVINYRRMEYDIRDICRKREKSLSLFVLGNWSFPFEFSIFVDKFIQWFALSLINEPNTNKVSTIAFI